MGKEETLAGLLMELRRGTIVLCVLSQLKQPRYGYDLVKILGRHHMPVEANTLYPLLRRLEGQGLLQSSWLYLCRYQNFAGSHAGGCGKGTA